VENQEKNYIGSKKRICSEVSVNSPGESVESVLKKKRRAHGGKDLPGMKAWVLVASALHE